DLKIMNDLFKVSHGKGRFNKEFVKNLHNSIRDAIRDPIKWTPKCKDYDIDNLIRKSVVLPASTINPIHDTPYIKDKADKYYQHHEDVIKVDENSCYFTALTKFGKIAIPDPIICLYDDLPQFVEDNTFYSFR